MLPSITKGRHRGKYNQLLWLHELRTPKKDFFHRNPKLSCMGRQIGQINFEGIRSIFGQTFSTHFSTVPHGMNYSHFHNEVFNEALGKNSGSSNEVCRSLGAVSPLFMFSIIQPLFSKKKTFISKFQIFFWDWDLNLNLNLGLQRIRDLDIVCP